MAFPAMQIQIVPLLEMKYPAMGNSAYGDTDKFASCGWVGRMSRLSIRGKSICPNDLLGKTIYLETFLGLSYCFTPALHKRYNPGQSSICD